MSNNTLVRGAAVAGIVVATLAAGGGVAFAAAGDATACTNGAANYPDCTPTAPPTNTGTNSGGGPSTYVPPTGGVTTVVAGGAGTGTTEASGAATSLPFTGFEAGAAAAIGLAALGAGSVFIVASRRRRSNGDSAAA
jgi:hypothetical protein